MSSGTKVLAVPARVRSRWLEKPLTDLFWYVLSPFAGLAYVAIILAAASTPAEIFAPSTFRFSGGTLALPISTYVLVFLSYSWFFDGTHTFATLARVGFSSEERKRYRTPLLRSIGFLALGPCLVLLALGVERILLVEGLHGAAAIIFIIAFQVWGLFHIVRQHWGFIALYRAKGDELDIKSRRIDAFTFYALSFLPVAAFFTSVAFTQLPGVPLLPMLGASGALHIGLIAFYATTALFYVLHSLRIWISEGRVNVPKLALMASFSALVLLVFSDARLAMCMTPILGIGHNLQYHRIVWFYGHRKVEPNARTFPFKNLGLYLALGLAFTWLLYRGPLSEFVFASLAAPNGVTSMLRAMENPTALTVAQEVFGAFLIGFGCQHYYLDGKIWRLRADARVREQLLPVSHPVGEES